MDWNGSRGKDGISTEQVSDERTWGGYKIGLCYWYNLDAVLLTDIGSFQRNFGNMSFYNLRAVKLNTLHAVIDFTIYTKSFCFSKFHKFLNRYQACLYLNAFVMVSPNIVIKFQNFYIFETFVKSLTCRLRLLMPVAWKVLSLTIVYTKFSKVQKC